MVISYTILLATRLPSLGLLSMDFLSNILHYACFPFDHLSHSTHPPFHNNALAVHTTNLFMDPLHSKTHANKQKN
jgi:hypothetical protein